MTEFLFPDNTVLCNFAAVDRLDLLKSVLNGRGRWTEAVAYEASRSASKLPPSAGWPLKAGWTSRSRSPANPTYSDRADPAGGLRRHRRRAAETPRRGADLLRHQELDRVRRLLVDFRRRGGRRYAKLQGITTRETIDLMSMAVADGDISARDAFDLMQAMADSDRYLRLPKSAEELRAESSRALAAFRTNDYLSRGVTPGPSAPRRVLAERRRRGPKVHADIEAFA